MRTCKECNAANPSRITKGLCPACYGRHARAKRKATTPPVIPLRAERYAAILDFSGHLLSDHARARLEELSA